jgi:hypothetical protein
MAVFDMIGSITPLATLHPDLQTVHLMRPFLSQIALQSGLSRRPALIPGGIRQTEPYGGVLHAMEPPGAPESSNTTPQDRKR